MENGILLFCFLMLGFILVVVIASQNNKEKALQEATANYEAALSALKSEPSNVDLRQQALAAGRHLVSVAKDNKSSVFDEVALMNDLNAIQPTSNFMQTSTPLNTQDIASRLTKLEELLNLGTISQEEYQTRRSAILDQI